jgi:Domain of unknown function (DUF4287)
MAKSPEEVRPDMIAKLPDTSGKTLTQWLKLIRASKRTKHGEIVAFLKSEHGMTHGYANQIALQAIQSADAPAPDGDALVETQYAAPKQRCGRSTMHWWPWSASSGATWSYRQRRVTSVCGEWESKGWRRSRPSSASCAQPAACATTTARWPGPGTAERWRIDLSHRSYALRTTTRITACRKW